MPSAGELLRSERMKRSRSLSEIADATRISRRYLEAIEADQVQDLPGDFFYKAFIRQYARALELDAETTRKIVGSAVPVSEEDPIPVLHQVYERASAAEGVRWRPTTAVAIGVLVGVIAGGSGLYALWQRMQAREETPPQQIAAAPLPAPPAAQPAAPPLEQAKPTEPESTPAAEAAPAEPGETTVEIAATESAWVQLSDDGKPVYTSTLEPGMPRRFTVGSNAKLVTGNAGGIEVKVNGKPVGTVGPRGQVRTVVITAGNAQVVAPKPKPPAEQTPAPPAP
jgi:cytoskeletal protein RodZ